MAERLTAEERASVRTYLEHASLENKGGLLKLLDSHRRAVEIREESRAALEGSEPAPPTDTSCEWCGGTDITAVHQGPYLHHMCQKPGCAHEWDVVPTKEGK